MSTQHASGEADRSTTGGDLTATKPGRRRRRSPVIDTLVASALVVFLCYLHARVVRVAYVTTGSMQPTIYAGDRVLVSLGAYRKAGPKQGDIIAFWAEDESGYEVKRVVGVGGDALFIGAGQVVRNGELLNEPYIAQPMLFERPIALIVPEGKLFLMGDNRNGSEDSRDHGAVREDQVLGRVFFRVIPVGRFGRVE